MLLTVLFAQVPTNVPLNSGSLKSQIQPFNFQAPGSSLVCTVPTSKSWSTDPGFFRQSGNDTATPCTPGFWCPKDTFQPVYCCAGFFCSSPSSIEICPNNQYCPTGSITGQHCWNLAPCPIGTIKPVRVGMLVVIIIVLIAIAFGFNFKKRVDIEKAIRNKTRIEMVKQDKREGIQPPKRCHNQTFDIEFDCLQFVLPDGTAIMDNVSGSFASGQMTAVMGPSGAGKSTLFSLLTGKIKRSNGVLLLNGTKDELSKYQKLVGYVPQDDIMLKELTVNDILSHSAHMRLPVELEKQSITKKVVETIEFLGMGHVINTIIGDEETRGISGGQRKRVNIGMEIVAEPSVLFLDEPTSGLDSSTSLELCQIMNKLAKENKMTIAAVIHSPSPQTFFEFDNVIFLCKGGMVCYFGPTKGVANYFKELGFQCEKDINPADFAMDVVSGKIECKWDPEFLPSDLPGYWECYKSGIPINKKESDPDTQHDPFLLQQQQPRPEDTLKMKFIHFSLSLLMDIKSWALDVFLEFHTTVSCVVRFVSQTKDPVRSTPNMFAAYVLLLRRAFKQQFRSARIFIFDSVIHFVAGLVISVAIQQFTYLGRQPQQVCDLAPVMLTVACEFPSDFLTQAGMLTCIGVFFAGQATASYTFGNEKIVYWRDTAAGMPTIPYFLAKFTSDAPRIVIAGFFYTLSVTIFFDYRSTFADLMLVNLALYYVAFNFGYFISIVFNKSSVPLLTAANALLWGFVFGGVTPDLNEVFDKSPSNSYKQWQWLWNISGPRWAIEGFYIKEARARPWAELQPGSGVALAHGYQDNYSMCIQMLFRIGTLWAFLSFLALKLTNRRKQK